VKTILILGAGVMQIPGIRIAKRLGWRVIAADGNRDALAKPMCDRFEQVDLKDRDGLLSLARECAGDGGLDGVFTAGTDFSASVAWVAERMGLPGISYQTALRATDKRLMREAFALHGVPSPRFASWSGEGDPRDVLAAGLHFPLVVKPVDNMGARGVRRVDDPETMARACRDALPLSRSSRVIVEQYMEGRELSLDAVVYHGEISICGVADRHICFPPWFVEMGHTMPTDLDKATVRRIEAVFSAGIRALGIDNGAAKGDLKLTNEGPMVGEIAARLSGGYMSGWTFPYASGVEVTEAALKIAVGLPPGDLAPRRHAWCAERALISIPGVVENVSGHEEARELRGVKDVFIRVEPGHEVVFPANNVQKCGSVIAVGRRRDAALASAERALSVIDIRLVPMQERTTRYIFAESGNDAFAAVRSSTRDAIAAMPPFTGDPRLLETGSLRVVWLDGVGSDGARDWYGVGLEAAAERVMREPGMAGHAGAPGSGSGFALAGLFWRALLRGSSQAAIYLVRSAREASRAGALPEFLSGL
jgi:biotin carboxylase